MHSFYVLAGGFYVENKPTSERRPVVDIKALVYWIRDCHDSDNRLPDLSEEEISDKDKAGSFTKGLALFQVFWFVAQFITRLVRNLPVSLLEVNTGIHSGFAFLTYALWWYKPFDVDIPTKVKPPQRLIDRDSLLDNEIPMPFLFEASDIIILTGREKKEIYAGIAFAGLLSVFYGALHVGAWHASFPTVWEETAWRVSAVAGAGAGGIIALIGLLEGYRTRSNDFSVKNPTDLLLVLAGIISFLGHAYIVVESIVAVRALPPDAYKVPQWTKYVPHFGS